MSTFEPDASSDHPRFDAVDCLEIATPCDVAWDSLPGTDRVRHCGRCRQDVYNLEALDRGEALKLISIREHRVCLRMYRRPDGTVVTADCWSRLRAARQRGVWAFAGMLLVVAWAQLAAMAVGLYGLRKVVTARHHDNGAATLGLRAPPRQESPVRERDAMDRDRMVMGEKSDREQTGETAVGAPLEPVPLRHFLGRRQPTIESSADRGAARIAKPGRGGRRTLLTIDTILGRIETPTSRK